MSKKKKSYGVEVPVTRVSRREDAQIHRSVGHPKEKNENESVGNLATYISIAATGLTWETLKLFTCFPSRTIFENSEFERFYLLSRQTLPDNTLAYNS